MSQINQQIQQIIDKRKLTRLPRIEKEITFLKEVKAKVLNLDAVINTVSHQMETKQGSYYIMLQADPTMEARFMAVSTSEVKRLLNEQLQTLENLKKRFSRDAIQIAFIGYERQGKSCFLQSISGLNNKVIPAYSGTSCTGAVSVIHNVDKDLEVHIEFYDHEAFLKIVQEKLHTFFPNKQFVINSLNDLRYVDLSGFTCNDPQLWVSGFFRLVRLDQSSVKGSKSVHKELDIPYASKLRSKSLDFSIKGFCRCVCKSIYKVVYDSFIMILKSIYNLTEAVIPQILYLVVPFG